VVPVIRTAVELGVNFFDTAEVFGPFTNEELPGKALSPVRQQVVIATRHQSENSDGNVFKLPNRPSDIAEVVVRVFYLL
jgi:aryl-alcohol dehydrogenase-like predicted oxidoreductase